LEKKLSNLYFVALAVLFFVVLIVTAFRYYLRSRRLAEESWEDILKRLTRVDRDNIAIVALDVLGESDESVLAESGENPVQHETFPLDPSRIWTLLGGLEGLEILEHNCHVLVDLASYIQRWHPEALVVAEQLRLNVREIEWHVGRLKGAAATGNLQSSFADYAQRATVTYYLMTKLVLQLYDQVSFPQLAELQRAL
jgi:hypothetical protein